MGRAQRIPRVVFNESRLQRDTLREIKRHLHETCNDRVLLLSIVAGGVHDYLRNARKAFDGYAVDDDVLYAMFAYFSKRAGSNPSKNLDQALAAEFN